MRSRPGRSPSWQCGQNPLMSTELRLGTPAAGSTMHKVYDFSVARRQQNIYGKTDSFQDCEKPISIAGCPLAATYCLIIRHRVTFNKSLRPHQQAVFAVNAHRRLPQTLTVQQAAGNSPSLARLTELVQDSNDRLKAIGSLIPEALRPAVQAGPIDGESWCLLVNGNAAAAKIRQLTPLLQASLSQQGWKVSCIRLKILVPKK